MATESPLQHVRSNTASGAERWHIGGSQSASGTIHGDESLFGVRAAVGIFPRP